MSKSLNQFSSSFVCLAGRAGAAYLVTMILVARYAMGSTGATLKFKSSLGQV